MSSRKLKDRNFTKNAYIGLDIGKTKMATGIVLENGEIVLKDTLSTDIANGSKGILNQCRVLINRMLSESTADIQGIGVGSFGVVDYFNGAVISSRSLPEWKNIEIKSIFQREYGIPVLVDNDVCTSALGESVFGAGCGKEIFVFLTISTGVGFCTIYHGRVLHGSHNLAGQIGSIQLFYKGSRISDIFSGMGISRNASKLLGHSVTTKEVFHLADNGNPEARRVIDQAIECAALAITWIQHSIDPEVLIIGGSVALNQRDFMLSIKRKVEEHTIEKYAHHICSGINIVPAMLGDNSGIIGSTALFRNLPPTSHNIK
jgi:glucokinase